MQPLICAYVYLDAISLHFVEKQEIVYHGSRHETKHMYSGLDIRVKLCYVKQQDELRLSLAFKYLLCDGHLTARSLHPTELTPRGKPCCIVRIFEECSAIRLGYIGTQKPRTTVHSSPKTNPVGGLNLSKMK